MKKAKTSEEIRLIKESWEKRLFQLGYRYLLWKPYIPWPKWLADRWGYWGLP